MLKTILALCGALLLATPGLHAQGARTMGGGGAHAQAGGGVRSQSVGYGRGYGYRGAYGGRYYGGGYGRGYGRYYYLNGVGYYYPFFGFGYGYGLGFGYPAYAYDGYWNGYAGAPYGYGYGPDAYEGRVADQNGPGAPDEEKGGELPKAVQRQLAKRGYYKGTVDGDFGTSSRSALSRFQKDNHLKVTGRIDEDSLEALGFTDRR